MNSLLGLILFAVSASEVKFALVLFFMLLAMTFFHVPIALAGVFLCFVGYVLVRRRADPGHAGNPLTAKKRSGPSVATLSLAVVLLLCGVSIAAVDVYRNGAGAVEEARSIAAKSLGWPTAPAPVPAPPRDTVDTRLSAEERETQLRELKEWIKKLEEERPRQQ